MNSFEKYFVLMKKHPEWFRNKGEKGEIKIITKKNRILSEQKKIRAKLKKDGKPCWIDIGVLAEDQWFYVLRDMVKFPNGEIGGYIRWINRKSEEGGGYNSVLLCIRGDSILMIRKFRHEGRSWSWEFPRGFGEPELSAEENAATELRQEVGITNAKLTCLTKVKEGKGGTTIFLVDIPKGKKIKIKLDPFEGISKYRWIKTSMLGKKVKNGQLSDWHSLWAYAVAKTKQLV